MFKRQHAAAFLFLCAGLTGPAAVTASGQSAAPAAELLEEGLAQYQAGNLEAAKDLLIQIDPMTLPKEQRQSLYDTATKIQTRLDAAPAAPAPAAPPAPAPAAPAAPSAGSPTPDPADTLRRADDLAASDPGLAIAVYNGLIDEGGDTGAAARARRADLLRGLSADTTRAKAMVDTAETELADGNLDAAARGFTAVQQSGADLGWFDQQRVTRGIARVQEARVAAAPAPTPTSTPTPTPVPAAVSGPAPTTSVQAAAPAAPSEDLLAKARREVADEYLRDARQAQSEGYDSLAVNLLSQAAELDPNNPEIRNSLTAARGGTGRTNALGQAVADLELQRQQALAGYQEAMTDANSRQSAGDFAGAATQAARARQIMELNENKFAKAQYDSLRQDAIDLGNRIDQEGKAAAAEAQQEIEATTAARDKKAVEEARMRDRDQVRDLIVRARALQIEMKYAEALLLLDQALFKDPTNFTAELLKDVIEDAKIATDYRDIVRERNVSLARTRNLNKEATIAYQDILTYPTNWPEISEERIRNLDVSGGETQANREASNRLRKTVPIDFDANSLESVIDYIRQTTEANIFVNWAALEDAGVERDMPVSLKLSNVSAEKALKLILQQVTSAAGNFDVINFSIIDGVITISTENDLFRSKDLRVFDIRDLLVQVPNFTDAPSFDLGDALSNTSSGGGGGGGGGGDSGGLFGDDNDDDENETQTLSRAELILQITELITETVGDPQEWLDFESTVRELNGNLIVRTTPDNHRQILGLLAKLRETRAIQISVEARFLLVDRNFLDEFGVDFNLGFNGDQSPDQTDTFVGFTGNNDNITGAVPFVTPQQQGFAPITAVQNNSSIARPTESALSFDQFFTDPGSKALNLGVSFIDDLSVNLVVEATLANRNSISLTAPRVTFFNGQRAFVTVARQISFISEAEPIPDAGGFDLTLSVAQVGVVLDVEGTISADRRYVTMTLRPSLAELLSLVDVPISSGTTVNAVTGEVTGGGSAIIQIPELEITTVNTTVSVPDRGTLLIGGQRLVGETEIEAGVPVLSKIPILNRLFTSNSRTEDERTLLILVKPTIIIQNEQEEELFPGIGDKILEAGQGIR